MTTSRARLKGSISVVCVRAEGLAKWQYLPEYLQNLSKGLHSAKKGSHLFGEPNAYVTLRLYCGGELQATITNTKMSNRNPIWSELFSFSVDTSNSAEKLRLGLCVYDQRPMASHDYREEVTRRTWSSDREKENKLDTKDMIIGQAVLELSSEMLEICKGKWQSMWLTLRGAQGDRQERQMHGDIQIKIRWDTQAESIGGYFSGQWNSAAACRVHGFSNTCVAGIVLLAARQADWLGSAPNSVDIPAAFVLMVFAILAAFTATGIQFLGTAGAFGAWNPGFPGFSMGDNELLHDADDERSGKKCDAEGIGVKFQGSMLGAGMTVSLTGRSIPVGPLRCLCWLNQIGCCLYTILALILALFRARSSGLHVGDGVYIAILGLILCINGIVHLQRAAKIERDTKQSMTSVIHGGEEGFPCEPRYVDPEDETPMLATRTESNRIEPGCFAMICGLTKSQKGEQRR